MQKQRKMTSIQRLFLLAIGVLIIIILGVQLWRLQKPHYSDFKLDDFKSSDAKLAYSGYVITSKNNHLYLIDSNDLSISEHFIRSNWVDALLDENIIVYSNDRNETGICHFDPTTNTILDNTLILNDNLTRIDPSLVKFKDHYYLTSTVVEGTINRADYKTKNGIYTIQLFESVDLVNWNYITDIYSAENNLEDVEIDADKNVLRIVFEVETIDKGPSSIQMSESYDYGMSWSSPIVLISNGADNEPASFGKSDNEYWLFYSSDISNPGSSYEGSKPYLARFDFDFNLLNITQIKSENESQVLLYEAIVENGTATILYANDYLGTDDLCLENKGFLQIQNQDN